MERERFYEFINENIRDSLSADFTDATFKVQDINKTSGMYVGLVMEKPGILYHTIFLRYMANNRRNI